MNRLRSFSIIIFLISFNPGSAQVTLTVSTLDAQTGTPLDSALVTLTAIDNSLFEQKHTDITGTVMFADIITHIETSQNVIPESFTMSVPYPQPVKTNTAVELILSKSQDVDIAVYNVLGQRVLHENYHLTSGHYGATFDLNHLSAGLYVIRAQAGQRTIAQKIIKTSAVGYHISKPIDLRSIDRPSFSGKNNATVQLVRASTFRLTVQKPGFMATLDSIVISADTTIVRSLFPDPGGNGRWDAIGPYGIDVSALVINPLNPDVILAAASSGDLFISADGASNWQIASRRGAWIRALKYHPTNPLIVYAGLDLFSVEKSTDGGLTWTGSGNGLLFDPFIYDIAFHPLNPDTMYVATFRSLGTGGIYKSVDSGNSWTTSQNGMADAFATTVVPDPVRPEVLYAGTYKGVHGIYKSIDSGASWAAMNNGLTDFDVFAIAIDPVHPDTLFSATAGGGVFISENAGVSWQAGNTGITNLDIRALVISPQDRQVLYASGAGNVFKTTDGGQNWSAAGDGITNPLLIELAIDPQSPENIYAGATGTSTSEAGGSFFGGIFKSPNAGENWQFSSTGLLSADVRSIAIHPYHPELIYAGTAGGGSNGRGVIRSTDGGHTWNSSVSGINIGLDAPEVLDVNLNPDNPDHVLAATLLDGVYRSTNGGVTWTQVLDGGQVQDLARNPRNPQIVLASESGIKISSDGGQTWATTSLNAATVKIVFDPSDPAIIYAGAAGAGVYKSIDGGANWEIKNQGMINTSTRSLAISARDPRILYAGTLRDRTPGAEKPPQIYRTTDGAENWEKVSQDEFEAFVLLVDPLQPNILYAGNLGAGIRKSTDGGVTWTFINDNLGDTQVLALTFHPLDPDIVYSGTVGGGVFRVEF